VIDLPTDVLDSTLAAAARALCVAFIALSHTATNSSKMPRPI
jgi:hypothetical protein